MYENWQERRSLNGLKRSFRTKRRRNNKYIGTLEVVHSGECCCVARRRGESGWDFLFFFLMEQVHILCWRTCIELTEHERAKK